MRQIRKNMAEILKFIHIMIIFLFLFIIVTNGGKPLFSFIIFL